MNYKAIYDSIMDTACNRVLPDGEYKEEHHIVPDFMFIDRNRPGPKGHLPGNPNDKDNLVYLTLREHMLSHLLLAKHLSGSRYGYQAGSALMFFHNIGNNKHPRSKTNVKKCSSRMYEMAKILGKSSISKSRKGKMPCVDAATGDSVGSHDVSHPKVMSGEWQHHSKGKPAPKNGRNQSGSSNGNYKELTDDMFMSLCNNIDYCIQDNHLIVKLFIELVNKTYPRLNGVSDMWIKNKFGGGQGIVCRVNDSIGTNYQFNRFFRSSEQKASISASVINKRLGKV